MKKELTSKQFAFMMFNYVVGFGFLTTIGTVIKLGSWGILVFFATAFIAFGVMLTFSRLSAYAPETKGASYGYAKLAFDEKKKLGKSMIFMQGWNQYMQGPILGVTAPLFLESILKDAWPDQWVVWKILSIAIFVLFIALSLFRFKKVFKIISFIASIKWVIIALAFILSIYLSARHEGFSHNWLSSDKATASTLTGAMLSFMFAFGGIEGVAAMVNKVETKGVKKTFFWTFIAILTFYFIFYIVLFIIDKTIFKGDLFKEIYNISFGVTGIVLFSIGFVANKASSIVNSAVINAELLTPLSEDKYFPEWIAVKNKDGVSRRAILLSASITLLMMTLFQIIQIWVDQDNPFLNVVNIGTIAFFVQYFFTAISLIILLAQKKLKVPTWEMIAIYIMMLAIVFILLTQMIPPVVGDSFSTSTYVIDVSFFGFMGLGFAVWGINSLVKNWHSFSSAIRTLSHRVTTKIWSNKKK